MRDVVAAGPHVGRAPGAEREAARPRPVLLAVVVEQAEKHLVDCADGFDAKHLKVLGRHVLTVVAPAPEVGEAHEAKLLEDEERRAAEKTRLTFASDGHGMVHGRFSIPTLHGAMLAKAIQALTWARQESAEVRQTRPTPVAAGQAFTELLERMDALEDHAALARKSARHRALRIAAGQMQVGQPLRDALRQSGRGGDSCPAESGILQETAAACFGRELGIQSVHGRILSGKMVAGAAVRSKRSERCD